MNSSATVTTSNEAFEPNLKKDPRLVYRKFRVRLIYEVSTLRNDITHPKSWVDLFPFFAHYVSCSPWQDHARRCGQRCFVAGYDIVTAIAVPPNNASAITVKVYEIASLIEGSLSGG